MEHLSNTSPRSIHTPQSPPAPLALSDFMAQTAPCSDITPPSDKPPFGPDVAKPEVAEPPVGSPAGSDPRPPSPQQQPDEPSQQAPEDAQDTPAPTDWLATRQQLLPWRNQGRKADWIRGWSTAVSTYGDETYCACSAAVEAAYLGHEPKTSDLAGNVRAIFQKAGSSPAKANNNNTQQQRDASAPTSSAASPEPAVCRNCSRPASPPASTTVATTGRASDAASSSSSPLRGRSLGRRVTELIMRVRPSRSAAGAHAHDGPGAAEGCHQPLWATTGPGQKRFLARPPPPPPPQLHQQKSRSMDLFRGRWSHSGGRGVTASGPGAGRGGGADPGGNGGGGAAAAPSHSDADELEDSDADDAPPRGLSRSMSRLQRAATLLQRASARPKD